MSRERCSGSSPHLDVPSQTVERRDFHDRDRVEATDHHGQRHLERFFWIIRIVHLVQQQHGVVARQGMIVVQTDVGHRLER